MAVGTLTALAIGGGIAAAAAGTAAIVSNNSKGSGGASAPIPMPSGPSPEEAADKAAALGKKKRAQATESIYTSPLGISGQANVVREGLKEKLGQ